MKKMSYAEAIREGMSIRMREDPNVLLFGEDVGAFGGCFGVTAGMFNEFGDKRYHLNSHHYIRWEALLLFHFQPLFDYTQFYLFY